MKPSEEIRAFGIDLRIDGFEKPDVDGLVDCDELAEVALRDGEILLENDREEGCCHIGKGVYTGWI